MHDLVAICRIDHFDLFCHMKKLYNKREQPVLSVVGLMQTPEADSLAERCLHGLTTGHSVADVCADLGVDTISMVQYLTLYHETEYQVALNVYNRQLGDLVTETVSKLALEQAKKGYTVRKKTIQRKNDEGEWVDFQREIEQTDINFIKEVPKLISTAQVEQTQLTRRDTAILRKKHMRDVESLNTTETVPGVELVKAIASEPIELNEQDYLAE